MMRHRPMDGSNPGDTRMPVYNAHTLKVKNLLGSGKFIYFNNVNWASGL